MRKLLLVSLACMSILFLQAQTPVVNAIKTSATITIDGNLNESAWQSYTTISKTILGTPNNTNTQFAVTWNNTYLYVGMRVTDANLFNESANFYDDDAFEIFIDADNNGGTTYGTNDRQFMKEWNGSGLFEKNNNTTGVLHAWAAITGGYSVEIAIPWSNVAITNPQAGRIIGFDVANDDDDNGGVREHQRAWAGDNDNWRYPRNFGDLVLQNPADTQAPAIPTGLTSTAITQTSFTLSWTASTDNVAVTGYDVYQNGVKINSTNITSTSYAIAGLTPGTTYAYTIKAKDAAANESAASTVLNVTTVAPDTQAPTVPTGLSASDITQTSFTLSWAASTDNFAVTGYDVYQNGVKINPTNITNTSYSVTGLTPGTTYAYTIRAKDAAANESAASTALNVTTVTPDTQAPTIPSGLSASAITQTSFTLSWTASTDNFAVTGYDVYQNGVKINPTNVTTTTYSITGLTPGTTYAYTIKAKDAAANESAASAALNVTTVTPDTQAPTTPSGLSASAITQTSFTLSWAASTDNVAVTGYDVYRNGTKINSSVVTTTSYAVTGLTAGTSYSFYVVARDSVGNLSTNSATLNVTTTIAAGTCSGTGRINWQRWTNITGTTVANLTSNANYPNNPASTGTFTSFEATTNSGDNFGLKVYGWICPPTTGTYVFWIASDDNAELWLSTTSSAANKTRIAYHTQYTNARQWTKYATQKSAAINLIAGQLYYVEALMKEGTQGDNLAVGWSKPGESTATATEVIPGSRLVQTLPVNDTQAPSVPTALASSNITQTSFTLSWAASTDNISVTGYDVYQNGAKINSSNITGTSYNITGLTSATTYSYTVKAKDAAANESAFSTALNVTTAAPDTEAPAAPATLSSTALTSSSVIISWSASTDNVAVTGYDIYRNNIKINTATITSTSYSVTGLTASTSYAFTVIAKDAAGNESAASTALTITTLDAAPGTETFTQRTVIANQRMPHDLVYGPDGNLWYIERFGGTVSFVNPASGQKTVVLTLGSKMARTGGQDGLMGLALHPQFLTGKPYVYISYTYQSTSATVRKTRIERYTYSSGTLGSPVTMLEDIPGSNDHNSSRISIGPDTKLYISVGDMGAGQFDNQNRVNYSQNTSIYEGKILRLNTELEAGSWIPTDNPFGNAVYTLGHRNPQGLVWGTVNNVPILYSSEHGPYSDDEINIIENGRNYGWPMVAGFCDGNYNNRTIGGFAIVNEANNCATINAKEPIRSIFPAVNPPSGGDFMTWPSTGVSGTDFYGGNAIPGWQNSLLVAQLKRGALLRLKLSNDGQSIISDTIQYFQGRGRMRDVVVSPDGLKIYIACDSSGSTSGPTQGVTTSPANPGSILEFTYQPAASARAINQQLTSAATVQENKKDRSIEIYPNPASDFFVVYNYSGETGRRVELYDVKGRLIKQARATTLATRIATGELTAGLYIIRVIDENGAAIRTEKIVIRK